MKKNFQTPPLALHKISKFQKACVLKLLAAESERANWYLGDFSESSRPFGLSLWENVLAELTLGHLRKLGTPAPRPAAGAVPGTGSLSQEVTKGLRERISQSVYLEPKWLR